MINCILQAAAEHEVVWRFVETADDIGLAIPGFDSVVSGKNLLDNWQTEEFLVELPPRFFKGPHRMIALAQHHGVPTRLLDWTKRPEVAAFFACEDVVRNPKRYAVDGRMAVWMIDINQVVRSRGLLAPLTVPRSENHYLHAQDGLFLWQPKADEEFVSSGKWSPFDEIVRRAHPGGSVQPWMIKLTLPNSEAPNLLNLLRLERVSRANLMPGYSSVADTVTLEWTKGLQP
jgi:hypothetical protein